MTEKQISIVKRTWKILRNLDPAVLGDTFYSKLFIDHPRLRQLFPKNMNDQYNKLIHTLSVMISRLDHLAELNEEITAMAERHVQYGVKPVHYKFAGDALLWTLQHGLGDQWTEETKEAWTVCYTTLSKTMISASGYKQQFFFNKT